MSIPGSALPLLLASPAGAAGYEIERSIRLNSGDSAFLSRTPASAGNRKTWTWAAWVKRSKLGGTRAMFGVAAGGVEAFDFNFSNQLRFYVNGGFPGFLTSTAVFRDVSAWLHLIISVDTSQATASDRVKFYVNGVQVTQFSSSTYPSQNYDTYINNNNIHYIGDRGAGTQPFDGYLADIHFIDGQALDPTSFGEFDATTGVWNPIEYTGTYGTNGFHLPFSDNSSASALGTDDSGNGNDWTVNNISVASGAGNDSLRDSPTNGDTANDTGAGGEVPGNYAVWNRLFVSSNSARTTISNGNLDVTSVTTPGNYAAVFATLGISSGKFYWEVTQNNSAAIMLGIAPSSNPRNNYYLGESSNEWGYYSGNGTVYSGGSSVASYTQYAAGDVVGIAFDADNGKLFFSLNGTWQGSSDPAAGTNPAASGITTLPQFPAVSEGSGSQTLDVSANFGQRPFAYTAPSGFKALCTANLDTPTIEDGSTAMDVALWTGDDAMPRSISGLGFSPDFVWIKQRNNSRNHALFDVVRGANEALFSNLTNVETTYTNTLMSFDSNGFSVGYNALTNVATATYVGWTWDAGSSTVANTDGSISSSVRANASAGFSIVSYTGAKTTTTADTVGHGLNVEPALLICKDRDTARGWLVYHKYNTYQNQSPNTNALELSLTTQSYYGNSYPWGSTTPTSSVFTINNLGADSYYNLNQSGKNYIAYCFAPVEGYSAFGSYTGNGSADGPFVYTGFAVAWLLTKNASDPNGRWEIKDLRRPSYNARNARIFPDGSDAEGTGTNIDLLSNGFKWRTSDGTVNDPSGPYVWAAFAESPFRYARAR